MGSSAGYSALDRDWNQIEEPTPDAKALVAALKKRNAILVMAESCTAGMVAARIAGVPGTSNVLAGSSVVYQVPTKSMWLGVPKASIDQFKAESPEITEAITRGVLERTPHATMAVGITGHLGPGAPKSKDGVVYGVIVNRTLEQATHRQHSLSSTGRVARQVEAADWLIARVLEALRS
ncbi:MAG: CinA family protein [Planctomycetota bacterium]